MLIKIIQALIAEHYYLLSTELRTARHIWDVPACYFDATFAQVSDLLKSTHLSRFFQSEENDYSQQ